MITNREEKYLRDLLRELRALPTETEWVEFKVNNKNPQQCGKYISAISNSAALCGKPNGYVVWGVDNDSHEVVGTTFTPRTTKEGNEELENWLLRSLSPQIHFSFYALKVDAKPIVILEIARAATSPVQFQGVEYIRIGTYTKKLKEHPEKERVLWRAFDETPFERRIARERIADDEVLNFLDYPAYFELLGASLPDNRRGILERLKADEMIAPCEAGGWNITNLGAILFAKKLDEFTELKRKATRVIIYRDNSRVETVLEKSGSKGYACGFEGLASYINNLLPRNEVVGQALREEVAMYPELAVRELVANALIHQDFFIKGTGPMVEIFSDRMEITNPGIPLIATNRFLDSPPKSRNEGVASFMRRIGVCEERGSGIDKVVFQTERYQLPAPVFEVSEEHTRAVLFAHKPLNAMDKNDKIRACYLHACLRYVRRENMTNSSLRGRFGIEPKNSAIASRIIADTLAAELIKPVGDSMSRKHRKYVPLWA